MARAFDMLRMARSGGILDTQTVTVGDEVSPTRWGFNNAVGFGSISDSTSNIYGGGSILAFYWSASSGGTLYLQISGSTNSGWTKVVIGTNTFLRADATYSGSTWTWTGISNPFGTTIGANVVAVWS